MQNPIFKWLEQKPIVQKIGPCKFSELPQPYRDQFTSGNVHSAAGQFFPYKSSSATVAWAIFFSCIYILPAFVIIYAIPYYIYQDSTLVPRIIEDLTSGLFPFLVIITIFGAIVWITVFMLKMGWQSLARVAAWRKMQQAITRGEHHYGLLLDEQNLVFRHGEHFDDYTCAVLPKHTINKCFVSKVRVWFPKQSFDINVVKLYYVDKQEQSNELVLREHFSLSALEMCDQIQAWLGTDYGERG